MSYGEKSSREMMAGGMDFCSADRQGPFQDPLTPLSSDQIGQKQSPDYPSARKGYRKLPNGTFLSPYVPATHHRPIYTRSKGSHRKSRRHYSATEGPAP
ncbi:hypothetical protein CEXT_215241 [Caerostris extrusa]|uniref:Uncharacterized protein n=1 Tax=Caerostris extrusa TaxID=172846 RepID=A0AAV4PL29_CAEEX|nr:hypothetical protein CEXT_215241 [Caerostris extrusa]